MNIVTLSSYIKVIRKHSKNCRRSYQNILEDLFNAILDDKSLYYVESTTSSRIMNCEYDVPYEIREQYVKLNEVDKKKVSDKFINDMIDDFFIDNLVAEVKEIVNLSDLSKNTKDIILSEVEPLKVLSTVLSISIISSNRIDFNKVLFENNNAKIYLISGDIIAIGFNKKLATSPRIVVIPVDDKFTMMLKDEDGEEIISKDTIHGKWIIRMNKLGINNPKIKFVKLDDKLIIGKLVIEKTEFYLLPVSSLKERNKAVSSIEMIKNTLNDLANEYNVSGQGRTLYIPLIGTGRSRANLSLNESISIIKDVFIYNSNGFFGNVKIVVHKNNICELEKINDL